MVIMTDGFTETEIGLIPNEWEITNLGNVTKKITKGTTPTTLGKNFVDKGINFIKAESIQDDGSFIEDKFTHIDKDTNELLKRSILEKNDVLFSIAGVIGRTALVKRKILPANTNQAIAIIRPKSDIIVPQFLRYYMSTKLFGEVVKSRIVQTAQANVSLSVLSNSPVILPNVVEQSTITNILSCIDQKIDLNIKINKNLEELGKTLFRHWFVHFEFPDSEGQPYKASRGEMVDSELGEIPKGWEVKELGTVIETTGGGTPSTKKEEYWENGNIQWYSPRDITKNNQMFITNSEKNINKVGLKHSSARLFPPYSLMMTSRATVGELSINTMEASTNQGFITCIPNEKLSTYYLYFWIKMNKEYIISLASGSTFREINKSTFRALNIIIPSNKVLSTYNSLLKPIFKQIETLQAQNKELIEIRDSLLPKLMSGKIRVNIPEEATAK